MLPTKLLEGNAEVYSLMPERTCWHYYDKVQADVTWLE